MDAIVQARFATFMAALGRVHRRRSRHASHGFTTCLGWLPSHPLDSLRMDRLLPTTVDFDRRNGYSPQR